MKYSDLDFSHYFDNSDFSSDDILKSGEDNNKKDNSLLDPQVFRCLNAIYKEAFAKDLTNFIVQFERRSSDKATGSSKIRFDEGMVYNKDLYDIVLTNSNKYDVRNYDFIISNNDGSQILLESKTIKNPNNRNQSDLEKNKVKSKIEHINKKQIVHDDDIASKVNWLLNYGGFFCDLTVSRTNRPQGNLSDYLLIKSQIDTTIDD